MQRKPYAKANKPAILMCSNPKCDNISYKFYIVENKIIEALKIWLENYKLNYDIKDNSYNEFLNENIKTQNPKETILLY